MSNITIQKALQKIVAQKDLSPKEMNTVMHSVLNGEATAAQMGGLLVAMRMKGETVTELVAATKVLRQLVLPVKINHKHLIDIVGTGGDHSQTFNISTASAIVAAAAGAAVAKHGSRSITSQSGSADVLEAAGVNLKLTPLQIATCVRKIGIGFMFAPHHHSAMQHVFSSRKELGLRTFFNLLGPLTNPAHAKNLVIGVFSKAWVRPIAEVLQQLGSKHVLVVHSEDGLDEISIGAPTAVAELKNGVIRTYTISPTQFGFQPATIKKLKVATPAESLAVLQKVLQNQTGAARDIVILNAGAAIYVAGLSKSLKSGISKAKLVLQSGAAEKKFQSLIKLSQTL